MKRHLVAGAAAAIALCGGAVAHAQPAAPPGGSAALEGDWSGQVDVGAAKLRALLHVHTRDGRTVATLDSPDQNATGLPTTITVEAGRVHIAAAGSNGSFDGELSADGASLTGNWSGYPASFTRLAAGQTVAEPRRPQTPVKPYPYREEQVSYPGGSAGVRLAGTLTLPDGKGPFPAVVLVAGSGFYGRDERIFGHALFLVLADHLTRHGLAVLRFDKRGDGQSTGDFAAATSADFAADVEAGAAYLRSRPEIDRRRIGLIGHSEGGVIAPMVADLDPAIAFLVLLAGPGVRGDQIIMAQTRAIAAANGAPSAVLDAGEALERRSLDVLMAAKDQAAAETAVRAELKGRMPDAAVEAQVREGASPWFRFFITYDPAPALRRLHIPVLALIGSKDLQVLAGQNLPALRAALARDPRAEVAEIPGLNHLLQEATTGSPAEYGQIEQTLSPSALARITSWILTKGAVPR
jgi:pimeloyl-ACP methyl ester carboxylesterase